MPPSANVVLRTRKDAEAEEAILRAVMRDGYTAKRLGQFAGADWLVERGSSLRRAVVEVKHRYGYDLAYFRDYGLLIGVEKVAKLLYLAKDHDAQPVILIGTKDGYVLNVDAIAAAKHSPIKRGGRKRGKDKRGDRDEDCYVIPAIHMTPAARLDPAAVWPLWTGNLASWPWHTARRR